MIFHITKYGYGLVIGSSLIFVIFLVLALMFRYPMVVAFAFLTGIFAIFNLFFFRDPERVVPENQALILSPADGKVVNITEIEEPDYFRKKVTRVSIFLSVFNVHVNRTPVTGTVDYFAYNRGKFLAAFKEKASLENEQTAIGLINSDGKKVMFKQIAGIIARRIVCILREGNSVRAGEKMGMIRYGSRVDIFFETGQVVLKIKVGDKVKGGESIIGEFI